MRLHKRMLALLLASCLFCSLSTAAFAAEDFTMTYRPGTTDTVTELPDPDAGTGGEIYAVSSQIPQREGYEFIAWTLDYGVVNTYTLTYHVAGDPNHNNALPGDSVTPDPVADIAEGGSVTLANVPTTEWTWIDGTYPPSAKETYKVNYLEVGTDRVLAPQKVVTDQTIGSTVPEQAIDIDGYTVVGADTQDLTIKQSITGKWTFTGWCSDEACTTPITEVTNITADTDVYGKWTYETIELANNEITFYYKKQKVSYTVRYIDEETGESIREDEVREDVERGTIVTEYAKEIDGYIPRRDDYSFVVAGDEVIIFLYYYDYPDINMLASAPEQAASSDAEPKDESVLTMESNAEIPATASEPQEPEAKEIPAPEPQEPEAKEIPASEPQEPEAKEIPASASEEVSQNDEENVNENA